MGLPNNALSDVAFYAPWRGLSQSDPTQYTDSCMGGAGVSNPSGGNELQLWSFDTDGSNIYAASDLTGRFLLYTPGGTVESIRCCFDQNMHPFICFKNTEQWNYYWYDTNTSSYVTSQLPVTVNSVACALDDHRAFASNTSDICLFYTENNNLYYLRQRDLYGTAYLLRETINGTLVKVGMNMLDRFQLKLQANLL